MIFMITPLPDHLNFDDLDTDAPDWMFARDPHMTESKKLSLQTAFTHLVAQGYRMKAYLLHPTLEEEGADDPLRAYIRGEAYNEFVRMGRSLSEAKEIIKMMIFSRPGTEPTTAHVDDDALPYGVDTQLNDLLERGVDHLDISLEESPDDGEVIGYFRKKAFIDLEEKGIPAGHIESFTLRLKENLGGSNKATLMANPKPEFAERLLNELGLEDARGARIAEILGSLGDDGKDFIAVSPEQIRRILNEETGEGDLFEKLRAQQPDPVYMVKEFLSTDHFDPKWKDKLPHLIRLLVEHNQERLDEKVRELGDVNTVGLFIQRFMDDENEHFYIFDPNDLKDMLNNSPDRAYARSHVLDHLFADLNISRLNFRGWLAVSMRGNVLLYSRFPAQPPWTAKEYETRTNNEDSDSSGNMNDLLEELENTLRDLERRMAQKGYLDEDELDQLPSDVRRHARSDDLDLLGLKSRNGGTRSPAGLTADSLRHAIIGGYGDFTSEPGVENLLQTLKEAGQSYKNAKAQVLRFGNFLSQIWNIGVKPVFDGLWYGAYVILMLLTFVNFPYLYASWLIGPFIIGDYIIAAISGWGTWAISLFVLGFLYSWSYRASKAGRIYTPIGANDKELAPWIWAGVRTRLKAGSCWTSIAGTPRALVNVWSNTNNYRLKVYIGAVDANFLVRMLAKVMVEGQVLHLAFKTREDAEIVVTEPIIDPWYVVWTARVSLFIRSEVELLADAMLNVDHRNTILRERGGVYPLRHRIAARISMWLERNMK